MTTNTDNEAAFRQALLTSPGERQEVDYKAAVAFDNNTEFGLKLIKHILGMANTDGGWIVIGYEDGTLTPDPKHSTEVAAAYDSTSLTDAVNASVQRGQQVHLAVFMEKHTETQLIYPIIRVKGFERTPLICRSTKLASDTEEPILQVGKVYIRRPGAATSEIQSLPDWEDLLSRCVSQRRDEFLSEFADLFQRMTAGDATPDEDAKTKLNEWITEQRSISTTHEHLLHRGGYIESAQTFVRSRASEWTRQELQKAAILAKPHYRNALVPAQAGIEIRIGLTDRPMLPEYWYLKQDGSCYSSGLLREDYTPPSFSSSLGHPDKSLWFDLAILRIARELLDSARIYKELEIAPDEPYILSINHCGLEGRTIYASDPRYPSYTDLGRDSQVDCHLWQEEVTQDLITGRWLELTHTIANSLFSLFAFTEVPKELIHDIVRRNISLPP